MKFSDTRLQNAKPRTSRYDVTVTNRNGLMVQEHPSGVISFRFRYKRAGESFVMVLGEYGKQDFFLPTPAGSTTRAAARSSAA